MRDKIKNHISNPMEIVVPTLKTKNKSLTLAKLQLKN